MRHCSIAVSALLLAVAGPLEAQQDVFPLDGIVVTTSPTPRAEDNVASHLTVLSGEELRAEGITLVSDALRAQGGIDVVRTGSFGGITSLFVRGGESDHTLVLVDGVQVNQSGGYFDFSSLTTDNVERIEILRGPASALYGSDAMAGVIHVVTSVGQGAPRVRAGFETAHYGSARDDALDGVRWHARVTGGSGTFGYSAAISREEQDGILALDNRFLNTTLSGNARFAPDGDTDISISLRLTDREYHDPTDGSGVPVDANAVFFGDETVAGLTASRALSELVELEALLSVAEIDGGTDDDVDGASDEGAFFSLDHFRRASAELRANLFAGPAVVTVGGEIEEQRQRSFSEAVSSFGTSYGRSESERDNLAAFVHLAGERGPLAFNAGGRLEDNQQFGTKATWQLGASAHLPGRSGTRLRASVGTAIREPSFFENFATGFTVGNPDLDPERSLSWEVGLEHVVGGSVRVSATYFDQGIEDLIQYTSATASPGDPNYFNVGGAKSRGIEVDGGLTVGLMDAGATYTWLDTEVTEAGFDSGPDASFVEGARLLRRPTHTFAVHGSGVVTEGARIHTRMTVVGERADRSFDPVTFSPTRRTLPTYALLTVGGEIDVLSPGASRPGMTLAVRVENALDSFYTEAWGYEAPGRQLFLGVSMSLGGEP